MKTTVFIYLVLAFITYVTYIVKRYGIPPSLSNGWYLVKGSEKWIFALWCASMAFPIFYLTYGSITGMLSGLGMLIVATSPTYKNKVIAIFHYLGAGMSMVSGHLYLIFYGQWIVAMISLTLITLTLLFFNKNRAVTFWVEDIAFIMIFIGLFNILKLIA